MGASADVGEGRCFPCRRKSLRGFVGLDDNGFVDDALVLAVENRGMVLTIDGVPVPRLP
jgi:hypothetical protein